MSSDNYYVVRKHPRGGFSYVQGFASDDLGFDLTITADYPRFPSLHDAIDAACDEYSEYGVRVHTECYEGASQESLGQTHKALAAKDNHHLPECSLGGNSLYERMDDCICDNLRACEQRVKENGVVDTPVFIKGYEVGRQVQASHDIAGLIETARAKMVKDIRERVASELASLVADASISKNSARRIAAAIDGGAK